MVTLDELPRLVHDGEADTVVVAFKDMQGRLRGKGVHAALFVDDVAEHEAEGLEQELELPTALEGNAYESDAERFPSTLREAIEALEQGKVASAAFGGLVVDHYIDDARTEQRLFDAVVTCYERQRLFERI